MRLRLIVSAALTGALMVGAGWAATGLVPVPDTSSPQPRDMPATVSLDPHGTARITADVPDGQVLAGAAKVNIAPRPDDYGGFWQKEGCATLGGDSAEAPGHLPDTRLPWPEAPNCIYTGGFGIGPMNAVNDFDATYGLWVRTLAIGDGADTVVLSVIDATSYFGYYGGRLCTDCGAFDIADRLGAELGFDSQGFVLASTHSHAAPDLIGGWGSVPDWYMRQVTDGIETSVRDAVGSMRPAVLEAGERLARAHNNERRIAYRSAEDQTLSWMRAVEASGGGTIATLGTCAAHPTTTGTNGGVAHADWPGVFANRLEDRFGGIGLLFMSGLGNMSASGGTQMGERLADLVPEAGGGTTVTSPDVRAARTMWNQPATNIALDLLGGAGGLDRRIEPLPSTVAGGKSEDAPCRSGSAASVLTGVTAIKIGDVVITAAPGEIFANISNTIKERSPIAAFAFAQANDGLGYIMQSIEYDPAAGQVLGFSDQDVFEYEDAYAIDRCFGDVVLENIVDLLASP